MRQYIKGLPVFLGNENNKRLTGENRNKIIKSGT